MIKKERIPTNRREKKKKILDKIQISLTDIAQLHIQILLRTQVHYYYMFAHGVFAENVLINQTARFQAVG